MKGLSYEVFCDYVKELELAGILKRNQCFGYKKSFAEILSENDFLEKKGNAFYITSKLDNYLYCFTNGQFKEHLKNKGVTEFQYLEICGFKIPYGYTTNFKCHGKETKSFFEQNYNRELYFKYRSVLTSVSSDYRKLMFFYGISEVEARSVSDKKHKRYSKTHQGIRNSSYGKKGMNANCFRPFLESENPKEAFSELVTQRQNEMIRKWAIDNEVDETNFQDVKFKYFSQMFTQIHIKKGKEFQDKLGLSSLSEGIYAFNSEKSKNAHNPKNFVNVCLSIIEKHGTEEDKKKMYELLQEEEYQKLLSLAYLIRGLQGFQHKRFSYTLKNGIVLSLRSKLEKGFVFAMDKIQESFKLNYENIRIPYWDIDRERTYVVDFELIMNGEKFLIEVKPFNQCIIPEGKILRKKLAAEEFAKQNGYVYLFITEKDLKYDLLRKKLQSYGSKIS